MVPGLVRKHLLRQVVRERSAGPRSWLGACVPRRQLVRRGRPVPLDIPQLGRADLSRFLPRFSRRGSATRKVNGGRQLRHRRGTWSDLDQENANLAKPEPRYCELGQILAKFERTWRRLPPELIS